MTGEATTHPTDETLAAFADGVLDAATRSEVLAHVEKCRECMAAVLSANAHLAEERINAPATTSGRSTTGHWWAIAAAVLIAVVASVVFFRRDSAIERLASLTPRDTRLVEPRLSGGFGWAPYRGAVRAGDAAVDSKRLKLLGAAGDAIEAADRDPSNANQHAAGIAMVLIDRSGDAIERLRAVAERSPTDAVAWSDLAAARYTAAVQLQRPSLLPEALAAADRALRIDARSAAALFNRALILEHLGLTAEARAAWQRYLEADPSSEWSTEARERLSRLPAQSGELEFRKELPSLESAATASDSATVKRIVSRSPQQTRSYAEAEHLGLWGEAAQSGDAAVGARLLIISRAVGDALVKTSGESLLHDAVASIDRAGAGERATLARAHAVYRRGRMAYGRGELENGERDLMLAAALFANAHSPMMLAARYYAASARFDRHEVSVARRELEQLRDEIDALPHYAALRAQVRWELALCHMVDADWSGAAPLLTEAESGFRALGESANLGFVQTLIASTFTSMGRPDEAWAARIRSFEVLSASRRADRLIVSLGAAARSELRSGRFEPALAMLRLEEEEGRAAAADPIIVDSLVRQCIVNDAVGNDATAAANAEAASVALARIRDAAPRERAAADVNFARGTISVRRDPSHARALLASAIATYRAEETAVFLPEAYALRARASRKVGDAAGAMADLQAGIAVVERHPADVMPAGSGVLDDHAALYEEMIAMQLDRGDAAAAFAYAERERARANDAPIDVVTLQQRLSGTDAAVLELIALDNEVVALCVTQHGLTSTRTPVSRMRLEALIDKGDFGALYDLLIAPAAIDGARQLIVVPDARLEGVPFAALYDARGRRYLVQRLAVSIAASAASLQRGEAPPPGFVLAMALPAGKTMRTALLPESERELRDVRAAYRCDGISAGDASFTAFEADAPRAGIIHVSGHTEREPGAGEPALLFADQRVSWQQIARMSFPSAPIVVLAACETLRVPRDPQTRSLSLGGGFLAAGAATVIGTYAPITDGEARELFPAIHRRLAAGASPAAAVREVQLAAIDRGARGEGWKSIAVLTRRIAVRM